MREEPTPLLNPPYYQREGLPFDCYDIAEKYSFTTGNVIKYLWRWQGKNGVADLAKALDYARKLTATTMTPFGKDPQYVESLIAQVGDTTSDHVESEAWYAIARHDPVGLINQLNMMIERSNHHG